MAQVLKEEVRQRIILAAKNEFLTNGYEDASMRRIAQASGVTVGNLYRYFLNKDELLAMIVKPCLERIDHISKTMTNYEISFNRFDFHFKLSDKEIIDIIENMGDELFKIHLQMREEFMILLMDSRLSKDIKNWLSELLAYLIAHNGDDAAKALAESFAASIFRGLQDIFGQDIDEMVRARVLKAYLKAFMAMVTKREYMGEI